MLKFIQQNLIAIIIYQLVLHSIFWQPLNLTIEIKERLFQLKQTLFSWIK
jgi:hypothetical protein